MELPMKTLWTLLTLQMLPSAFATRKWDWEATFYQGNSYTGKYLTVHGKSPEDCVTLTNHQLCDDNSNCAGVTTSANSLYSHDSCVRLYESTDCSDDAMMELRPGTVCHDNWLICNTHGKVKSVGGCPSNDRGFNQYTTGILPSISLFRANITSTNFPGNYNYDENTNWIITVGYGRKIEIYFDFFDIEYDMSCEYDKLTITELISQETIFEGCGHTIPSKTIVSESNQVRINFVSDSSVKRPGFFLRWEACKNCEATLKVDSNSAGVKLMS